MSTPAVSVLMPVRNAQDTLAQAVGSVLRQTRGDFEVVAVDDASSDGTSSLLRDLAAKDARVRVLQGEGRGISAALNLGLAACRAKLLARMDADDECLPTRLEQSAAALAADEALAGVGTQVEVFREDRPVSPNLQLYARWLGALTTPALLWRDRFIESPLCHPSVTLRTEVVRAVGGWTDEPVPEDYDLWLRLLDAGHGLTCLPQVLLRWRDHEGRLTRTDGRYGEDAFRTLKVRHLLRGPLAGAGRCVLWGAGPIGLRLARALRAAGVEVEAFYEVSPLKVGQRIDGAPVLPWENLGAPRGPHLLAAVGAKGARENIREALGARGWREGEHFTCVA